MNEPQGFRTPCSIVCRGILATWTSVWGGGAGEACGGWWADQPVSGCLAGFSKEHLAGQ